MNTDTIITLTVREIFDLAKVAQVIPWKTTLAEAQFSDEDAETEYAILTREGGVLIGDDNGTLSLYRRAAYLDEYPDEGTFPLGDAQ